MNHEKQRLSRDFPGGPVVKDPPCNAGHKGWIPGKRAKILHAAEQLSPHTAAIEPADPRTHMPLESPCTATEDPAWWDKAPMCHNLDMIQPSINIYILNLILSRINR